jgi:hypothetical protein
LQLPVTNIRGTTATLLPLVLLLLASASYTHLLLWLLLLLQLSAPTSDAQFLLLLPKLLLLPEAAAVAEGTAAPAHRYVRSCQDITNKPAHRTTEHPPPSPLPATLCPLHTHHHKNIPHTVACCS